MRSPGTEPDVARLAAERACLDVLTAFSNRIDGGEAARVTDLFTEDGSFVSGSRSLHGRSELTAAFEARQADTSRHTRHLLLNTSLSMVAEDVVEASSAMLLFVLGSDPGCDPDQATPLAPDLLLDCDDRLERGDDGRWRLQSRRLTTVGSR